MTLLNEWLQELQLKLYKVRICFSPASRPNHQEWNKKASNFKVSQEKFDLSSIS